jgi:hypothetical protein
MNMLHAGNMNIVHSGSLISSFLIFQWSADDRELPAKIFSRLTWKWSGDRTQRQPTDHLNYDIFSLRFEPTTDQNCPGMCNIASSRKLHPTFQLNGKAVGDTKSFKILTDVIATI